MTYDYIPVPSERLLSLDPMAFGFGYAVLEYEPLRLVGFGTKTCRRDDGSAPRTVQALVEEFSPTAIAVPEYREGDDHPMRGPALEAFISAIGEVLCSPELPVLMVSPVEVREHFETLGLRTKYEIAEHLAEEFPELHQILPRPRAAWDSERAAMAVFDAVASIAALRA